MVLAEDLQERILPFDQAAASLAGGIAARQRQGGRTMEIRDSESPACRGA